MKILQANKFFYRGGGAETVFFDTIEGLRARGHEIVEFSMQSNRNLPSAYSKYFGPHIPEKLTQSHNLVDSLKVFKHLFYSREIEKKITELVRDTQPQVSHLHNIYHHLSASTFLTLRRLNIPTVLTLHDVFPLVPNRSFLIKDHLREDLLRNNLWNCVRYKCVNDSLVLSSVSALESYYYQIKDVWKNIDALICPSEFMRNKMLEYGYPAAKLKLVRNPFTANVQEYPLGNKIVFLGRIHTEKGIKIFMEACKSWRDYQVVVAGSGPEDAWVDNFIKDNKFTNIERHGWVSGETWQDIVKNAKVMVLPSIFYENCSVAILEAVSYGRIVVASNRGGNPEMVKDGLTGFLAVPENAEDLAQVVKKAMNLSPVQASSMTQEAKKLIEKNYQLKDYLDSLERVYKEIV